ncbi:MULTISPECIES: hypothetical protein [Amycolatopsis]|uniref:Uncharacterized protein n=2 Tax=Amycolatopsis TaxID=1813 RepID=A0A2A9FFJ7_9PSEU|nr:MULTISPECIES: hypothetical protein [Amycolatopsis]PFG50227.1 hypothetical protein ATK36_5440 [Amycolatopsis sulphurea]RJQ92325.1 hypothetical protein D5S19_00710 [Amycolatopsis panacis]
MPELRIPDPADRETLGAFVARAVRLDGTTAVRLRRRAGEEIVEAWTATPFEVLATRAVAGTVTPADVTVSGNELLAALTVAGGEVMDPGPARDLLWHGELPPSGRWRLVDELPVGVVSELSDRGVALARDNAGPHGTPPASLMDQAVLTVTGGDLEVKVQMRCLFALSGMGLFDSSVDGDVVRVSATDSWLRLDARYGAVLRRRQALLPLLF